MNKILNVIAVAASLVMSACGGSGSSTTINVVLTDFQFTPNTFTVPAGEEITVNATSNGTVVHNFVIMKPGTSAGGAFDDDDETNIYWELTDITPNGESSATFTAPSEPGEYEIVCRTEGHIASGMIGTLIVVAADQP